MTKDTFMAQLRGYIFCNGRTLGPVVCHQEGLNMIRKTVTSGLAAGIIGASAIFASIGTANAGYHYGGYSQHGGYGYGHYNCYWKNVRVWSGYGYVWKRVRYCG